MEKKPNPVLDGYKVKEGTPTTGINVGIKYNLNTISKPLIEAMIAKGSDLFVAKTAAEKKEDKPAK